MRGVWCLIPVKPLRQAKRRLAALLRPDERTELARAMALDVFDAAAGARELAGVAVITRDPDVASSARRRGFRVIDEDEGSDLCAAAEAGAENLRREGATGVLVIPADLPLASAGDLDALAGRHGPAPAVSLVRAEHDGGSNAVLCSPVGLIPFQYGPDSFERHRRASLRVGVTPKVAVLPSLGRDLDRPCDVIAFLSLRSPTRSHAFLSSIADPGIDLRCASYLEGVR